MFMHTHIHTTFQVLDSLHVNLQLLLELPLILLQLFDQFSEVLRAEGSSVGRGLSLALGGRAWPVLLSHRSGWEGAVPAAASRKQEVSQTLLSSHQEGKTLWDLSGTSGLSPAKPP